MNDLSRLHNVEPIHYARALVAILMSFQNNKTSVQYKINALSDIMPKNNVTFNKCYLTL